MPTIIGEAEGDVGEYQPRLEQALAVAIENAGPPPQGTDVLSFKVQLIELEHGGFLNRTKTRVTLEMRPGPLDGV